MKIRPCIPGETTRLGINKMEGSWSWEEAVRIGFMGSWLSSRAGGLGCGGILFVVGGERRRDYYNMEEGPSII